MTTADHNPTITPASPLWTESLQAELSFFTSASKAPEIRTLRQFAQEEFIIPEGPRRGEHFHPDVQPFAGLLIDEIDSDRWEKFRVTGNVQSGKTLMLFVLPACYYLFEWKETVICGLPTIQMAGDKWRSELLPAIEANPWFRSQLKKSGKGSKGGSFELMEFANGASLKFMGGQGGDATRSGFTSRIFLGTEVDRYDVPSQSSRETAPIIQMEKRTDAYGEDSRCFGECTVTTEDGFIWQEYTYHSSSSQIMCPCEHCDGWFCPEREDFVGHEDCESEMQAEDLGTFVCPGCAHIITDDERRRMNEAAKLVHRGQTIDKQGQIHGDLPPTRTLGFRWNEFNNLFHSTAFIAGQEWKAAHERDQHTAELARRQFTWVKPAEPDFSVDTPLEADQVMGRVEGLGRGQVPDGTTHLSAGVDLRQSQLHFVVIAWLANGSGRIIDFGTIPVEPRKYGVRKAVLKALQRLHTDRLGPGYVTSDSRRLLPGWVLVDAGWEPEPIRHFIRERQREGVKMYMPYIGKGHSLPDSQGGYKHPEKQSAAKPYVGDQYYVQWQSKTRLHVAMVNSDHWKSRVHDGFAMPADQPGAMTIYQPTTTSEQTDLRVLARHLVSERAYTKFVPGVGPKKCWENTQRLANHYLDATSLATVSGHLAGVRVIAEPIVAKPVAAPVAAPIMPDGGGYLLTDR